MRTNTQTAVGIRLDPLQVLLVPAQERLDRNRSTTSECHRSAHLQNHREVVVVVQALTTSLCEPSGSYRLSPLLFGRRDSSNSSKMVDTKTSHPLRRRRRAPCKEETPIPQVENAPRLAHRAVRRCLPAKRARRGSTPRKHSSFGDSNKDNKATTPTSTPRGMTPAGTSCWIGS